MIKIIRHIWILGFLIIMIGLSGCAGLLSTETVESASEEDVILAMEIKAKLIEATELSAAPIHVEASNGIVVLSGFTETESQRQLANSIARKTRNVKQVDNRIQVK
ncbi:BON domain-containing protein [Nitrosomonas aestuarii]|uniref:BON domain-containing protein n=1 Tax=Nitrosomonas aestuarii TaxID=52441 RepID=UPI000D308AD5|nr:BON domain-containing protein [Nitrosomonas aestuarii]PTN11998.1 BON domain-containing protein [Nitrosomonas aestuarii]